MSNTERCLRLVSEAVPLHKSGRLKEAITLYRLALRQYPSCVDAHHLLGLALLQSGDPRAAVKNLSEAIATEPCLLFARDLIAAYDQLGTPDQAIRILVDVASRHSVCAEFLLEIGNYYRDRKDYTPAAKWYLRAAEANSSLQAALINYGSAVMLLGKFSEAAEAFEKVARATPDDFRVHWMAGRARLQEGNAAAAVPHFQAALRLNRNDRELLIEFGQLLLNGYDLSGAAGCFVRALDGDDRNVSALSGLAEAQGKMGDIKSARQTLRKVLRIEQSSVLHSDLLFLMNHDETCTADEIYREHRNWASTHAASIYRFPGFMNERAPARQLRIGYVSPDFCAHPVGYFLEPILGSHSGGFHVYCYSTGRRNDDRTSFFRQQANAWRDVSTLNDEALAEQIREDKIDILVDLAGHTAGNRLLVFARKVAPVQFTYLGYPNTTGLDAVDYRLTDSVADPLERQKHHSETLVQIPGCFLCYAPPDYAPPPSRTPGDRAVVFGSFNKLAKINRRVIALWSSMLKSVDGSRLLVKTASFNDPQTRQRFAALFEENGVDPSRVELRCGTSTPQEHLATYAEVDIALDTSPYNGTTTTCEALWMGVPVVTLAGAMHAGRVGMSILKALHLDKLCAESDEEYTRIACSLAGSASELASHRNTLRDRMASSVLCDGAAFTSGLEEIYREVWVKWCTSPSSSDQ